MHDTNLDTVGAPSEVVLDDAYLDSLTSKEDRVWRITLSLEHTGVPFKMDTGAEVTAISDKVYQSLDSKPDLQAPTRTLLGPAHQKLKVLGQFQGTLSNGHISTTQSIYVIQGLVNYLLGLPAIVVLQLLQRLDSVVEEALAIQSRYKAVFTGLGTIGDDYQISLKEGAKAHALHTPRHVPIPLRDKVRVELNRMEAMGVISKIDESTEWCAGMVIVPKKSGAVRICMDLKPLNESVLRTVHPIPKVEETLALLSGASVFSKLDANSGFWQIPLAPESRSLTTFITPSGRYCFNKLPFKISSAPELFQKRMKKILE